MCRQDGLFRRMSAYQTLDGHKKDINSILSLVHAETGGGESLENNLDSYEDTQEQNKGTDTNDGKAGVKNSKRARLLAKDDVGILAVGCVGALLAGLGFPASGVSLVAT